MDKGALPLFETAALCAWATEVATAVMAPSFVMVSFPSPVISAAASVFAFEVEMAFAAPFALISSVITSETAVETAVMFPVLLTVLSPLPALNPVE